MINIDIISVILGSVGSLGLLSAGIGYGWGQFKRGGDEVDSKLIVQQKEYIVALEDKNAKQTAERTNLINSHQVQLTDLNKQLGILQGRLDEQGKKLEEYKSLLEGRDPQMISALREIREFMKTLADDSGSNRKRNFKIDSDTEAEIGKVLRKKK